MNEYTYVHAGSINNKEMYARLGKAYKCEWCGTAKVPDSRKIARVIVPNNEWIDTPLRREEPRWVCISCFLDVYCACNCLDFAANPDRRLVAQVAASEGMTTDEFRKKVWEYQISIIEADRQAGRLETPTVRLEISLKRLVLGEG